MSQRDEREQIKRAMGIGEHLGANERFECVLGETKYAIFVGGIKYGVRRVNDEFCTWIPGQSVCGDTVDQLRDKVIEALAAPKPDGVHLVYVPGMGMVQFVVKSLSVSQVTP